MTNAHGAHRPRQEVPPSHSEAMQRERNIAAEMWAHEPAETKNQRLTEATKESMAWINPRLRKGNK